MKVCRVHNNTITNVILKHEVCNSLKIISSSLLTQNLPAYRLEIDSLMRLKMHLKKFSHDGNVCLEIFGLIMFII